MTRRLIPLLSAAAFVLAGVALSLSQPAHAEALDDIKARGKMLVAIDPTFAPFEHTDASGNIVGFDPAVLELVAEGMGVEIDYQVMGFTGIIPGLVAGSFDFTATALAVRKERAERIDFTVPVAAGVSGVLRRSGDTKVAGTAPSDLSGLKAAVKTTTQPEQVLQGFNEELGQQGMKPIELLSVETVEQTIAALMTGRVDFVADDVAVLATVIKERSDELEIVGTVGPAVYISWGTNKNDPALNAALNEQIIALKESGKLAELHMEYFGVTFELPNENFIPAE